MKTSLDITFGTSGYRGIVGTTFRSIHVQQISEAIGLYLLDHDTPSVFIGYDPRPGNSLASDSFVWQSVDQLLGMGIDVTVASHPVPTPMVSWVVKTKGYGGGIIFTASHNPPEYNGVKFNSPPGGPASSEITTRIEGLIGSKCDVSAVASGVFTSVDWSAEFAECVHGYVNPSKECLDIPIVVDCRHGTAGQIWKHLASLSGLRIKELAHADPRSDFGGIDPNPTMPGPLAELSSSIRRAGAAFGVAHDPDADRHVICDENGVYVSPEMIAAVVANEWKGQGISLDGVVSTVASSALIRSTCRCLGISYAETPVGFKYFTPSFANAIGRVIGVESSGGFSVSDYLYEKCGFLPALIIASVIKRRGVSLSMLVNEVVEMAGRYVFIEDRFEFDPSRRADLIARLNDDLFDSTMGVAEQIVAIDGKKWSWADGSWVLVRLSGTEPLGRVYCESRQPETAEVLRRAAVEWALQFK